MNIEAISSIAAETMVSSEATSASVPSQGPSFSDYVTQYYNDVNTTINKADLSLREYAVGENGNIHEVLLSIEKAKTTFELGLQVRNRMLEAYQELMRMQV